MAASWVSNPNRSASSRSTICSPRPRAGWGGAKGLLGRRRSPAAGPPQGIGRILVEVRGVGGGVHGGGGCLGGFRGFGGGSGEVPTAGRGARGWFGIESRMDIQSTGVAWFPKRA